MVVGWLVGEASLLQNPWSVPRFMLHIWVLVFSEIFGREKIVCSRDNQLKLCPGLAEARLISMFSFYHYMDFVFCMVAGAANFSKDMSDLRIVIFLKFVRFGANLA